MDFTFWDILRNLLVGLQWTLLLSLVAFACGGVAGLLLLLARISPLQPLRVLARGYIELFQGTPLLMQLFLVFFGIALLGVDVSPWLAAACALTLFTSAFLAEIWRGCVESIGRGQWEAAESLAMSRLEVLRHVVLPQALRVTIAPTVSNFIGAVKDTSLVAIVNIYDITGSLKMAMSDPHWIAYFVEMYMVVCAVYLLIGLGIARYGRFLESRYALQ